MRRSFAVVALVVLVVGSMGLMRWSGKPPFGATAEDHADVSSPGRPPLAGEFSTTPGAAASGGRAVSGQAHIEPGGTSHHQGDREAALRDARKACERGVPKACETIGHGTARR